MWLDRLLPGELRPVDDGARSPRDWVVDTLVFAGAVIAGLFLTGATEAEHSELGMLADIVFSTAACLALWWRRRYPVAIAAAIFVVSPVAMGAGGAAIVACFNAAVRVAPRPLIGLAALGLVTAAITPAIYDGTPGSDGYDWAGLAIGVLITIAALAWGLFARARRELVMSLRERATRLEDEQVQHMEQAREAERRRIAREMHDVLAHRLSLLSVHAGALEFRPDAPPEEVAEAAGVIRETARSALEELRGVVGLLRDGDPGLTEPPQPTLADVPVLLEESRAAGMRVTATIELPDTPPPAALGRTAYRILQEGLTNARKHAPSVAVDVLLTREADGLVVEVVSRRAVTVGPPAAGTGTGLIGLAERVVLAGGTLEHGPDADGDFHLRATLPWP
jgi:signal transduction histidine kinase